MKHVWHVKFDMTWNVVQCPLDWAASFRWDRGAYNCRWSSKNPGFLVAKPKKVVKPKVAKLSGHCITKCDSWYTLRKRYTFFSRVIIKIKQINYIAVNRPVCRQFHQTAGSDFCSPTPSLLTWNLPGRRLTCGISKLCWAGNGVVSPATSIMMFVSFWPYFHLILVV